MVEGSISTAIQCFIMGLNHDLSQIMMTKNPTSLENAFCLARAPPADTGCELYIIERSLSKDHVFINHAILYGLSGINEGLVETLGQATIRVAARTKQLCKVRVTEDSGSEGYIPRIPTGPGIFAGECLARNDKEYLKILFINSTEEDVEFTLPPIELEDFECHISRVRTVQVTSHEGVNKQKQIVEIIAQLDLTGLNDEEKSSIADLVRQFPYQFHLPNNKLTHSRPPDGIDDELITNDDRPGPSNEPQSLPSFQLRKDIPLRIQMAKVVKKSTLGPFRVG
ncbi:hypothetical protein QAD02_008303 [Eretmocerus hayati]|uniref:Uncharacterized protein n=1 Tax=Eretmocerus hayati TaxID=131215 RepID=A0ACC2N7I8_9HYME|nr:hypothetical protein QAD02_008303 [Eretmocerus hayati]